MPFKSKAQIRKFYHLKTQGKMSQSEIDKWMAETPQPHRLPERLAKKRLKKVAFWTGFIKAADEDGGKGFTGAGKGQLAGELDHDQDNGIAHEPAGKEPESHASHELLDRERNPRDFSPFSLGPELEDENGSHIKY